MLPPPQPSQGHTAVDPLPPPCNRHHQRDGTLCCQPHSVAPGAPAPAHSAVIQTIPAIHRTVRLACPAWPGVLIAPEAGLGCSGARQVAPAWLSLVSLFRKWSGCPKLGRKEVRRGAISTHRSKESHSRLGSWGPGRS